MKPAHEISLHRRLLPLLLLIVSGCATSRSSDVNSTSVKLIALDMNSMKVAESSGVFVRADGTLITCWHAVQNKEPLAVILADGSRRRVVEVLDKDEKHDLALLKIEGTGFKAITLNSSPPRAGRDLRAATRFGVSEARCRGTEQGLIVFASSAVREGSSGGALMDGTDVVGIICGAFADTSGECVAVPAAHVLTLLHASEARRSEKGTFARDE